MLERGISRAERARPLTASTRSRRPFVSKSGWSQRPSMTTPPPVKPDPDRQDPLAHVKEFPDYYERLKRMEAEAERASAARRP